MINIIKNCLNYNKKFWLAALAMTLLSNSGNSYIKISKSGFGKLKSILKFINRRSIICIYDIYIYSLHLRRRFMTTQMIIKINAELKDKVASIAFSERKNLSEVVRELLENYVNERDIEGYIDELWSNIGKKMASKGVTLENVEYAVKKAREKKNKGRN
jgi:hypothetical protein